MDSLQKFTAHNEIEQLNLEHIFLSILGSTVYI